MVAYCSVNGCTNTSINVKNTTTGISFHAFPTNPELRKKWLQAIGRPDWEPPAYSRVCSSHFEVDQISHYCSRSRIKDDACPAVNIPSSNSYSASEVKVCRMCLATDIQLLSLECGQLKLCMETLNELKGKDSVLSFPQYVCYECGAHILKYYKLIKRSLMAQAALLGILADNGRITKRLVKQIDRKCLQSTLGYSEPAAMVVINARLNINFNDPPDHDYTKIYCKNELEKTTENFSELSNKELVSICMINCNKNSTENIILKSEIIDSDTENELDFKAKGVSDSKCEDSIDNLDTMSSKQLAKVIKTEADGPKIEKPDNDDVQMRKPRKCRKKPNTNKTKTTSNNSDTERVKDNSEEVTELYNVFMKSNEDSDGDNFDPGNLSGTESSDSDVGVSLMQLAQAKKAAKKAPPKTKDKKKAEVKKSRQEIPIEKVNCFKVTDMSLEDQIETWNTVNKEPVQYSQYECEKCTRKFVRKKAYEEHLPRHDPRRGNFTCPVCKERFRNATNLVSHTARNHSKKYECRNCTKVFYNLDKAQRHNVFHSGQVYSCPHCPHRTTHRSTAWEHVRTQHAHAHHCARCGHTFINAKGLATHRAMSHPGQDGEPKEPFPCEECNIVFHSEAALRVHRLVSKQHKDQSAADPGGALSPPGRTCRRCGLVFATRRELHAHARAHRRPAPPRRRAHQPDDYPRPCDHCDTELQSRFQHWCHVRREHPAQKHLYRSVVTAVCAVCGKGFQNKTMLKRHEQKHRGPATLKCPSCPRAFHDQYSLARHARAHSADRPHACPECGRAFKVRGNLERHRRMHTGETPYECKYCGKKFRYWESLTLHEKHMHQKVPWPARDRAARKRPAQASASGPQAPD